MYMSWSAQMVNAHKNMREIFLWPIILSGISETFQKRNITVSIRMHFGIQERSYMPVSLIINESKIFSTV